MRRYRAVKRTTYDEIGDIGSVKYVVQYRMMFLFLIPMWVDLHKDGYEVKYEKQLDALALVEKLSSGARRNTVHDEAIRGGK